MGKGQDWYNYPSGISVKGGFVGGFISDAVDTYNHVLEFAADVKEQKRGTK